MRSVTKSVFWLTLFTAVAVICTLIVLTALRSPVTGALSRYTATFSDVSGLYVGDDVRISGVQVGKVQTIRLDGRVAKVDLTAQSDHPVYTNTAAAVRYQTLIGQRYVELVQPNKPDNGCRTAASSRSARRSRHSMWRSCSTDSSRSSRPSTPPSSTCWARICCG